MRGIEPLTSSLPRKRSTPELHRPVIFTDLMIVFSNFKIALFWNRNQVSKFIPNRLLGS